jgi:thiol-disulfide isomerase/thioredoxin
VPEFSLPALDGSTVGSSSFQGRVTVIDFWASWCGPCRKSIPELVKLHAKYKDKVAFLGIALNDTKDAIEKIVQEDSIRYPILIGNNDVAKAYSVEAIPTMYILDMKGNVAFKETGFDADSGSVRIERTIKRLIGAH